MDIVVYSVIGVMGLFNLFKLFLEYKSRNNKLSENVIDIYDDSSYSRWIKYTSKKVLISFFEEIVSLIVVYLILIFKLFPFLDKIIVINNHILKGAILTVIFFLIDSVFSFVFSIIKTFGVEKEFGFTSISIKTFIKDTIVKIILISVLIFGLSFGVITLIDRLGVYSILLISGIYTLFSLFLMNFIAKAVMKLFYKFTLLEDSPLKEKINEYAKKENFNVSQIFVMNASSKNKKLNAFFQGYGKNRRIVLFDTLIQSMSEDEIVSVLAHEMGHSIHKDTVKSMIQSLIVGYLLITIMYFLLSLSSISTSFGFNFLSIPFGIYIALHLLSPISTIISIPLNYFSRVAEYKADSYAAKTTSKEAITNALKVLARQNFANLAPSKIIVSLTYSHPSIAQRIDSIVKNN
jgi:STE24 endopeptidase